MYLKNFMGMIKQDISAGSIVKAGRLIGLTVSLGGVIDTVGSYEGQTVQAVQAELHKLFAGSSSEHVLIIGEPIGIVSGEPEGTILSQEPKEGTEINDVTELIFHISRGKEQSTYTVPTMKGFTFDGGLAKISQWSVRYRFSVRNKKEDEKAGMIVSQNPARGEVVPWSTVVEMVMTRPEKYPANYAFDLKEIVVPSFPISIPMTFERLTKDGAREIIFTKRTFGGALTIPYLEEVGTQLIITVNEKEIETFTVRQQ